MKPPQTPWTLAEIASEALNKPLDEWTTEEMLAGMLEALSDYPDDVNEVDVMTTLGDYIDRGDLAGFKAKLRSVCELWVSRRALEALSGKEKEDYGESITGISAFRGYQYRRSFTGTGSITSMHFPVTHPRCRGNR